MRLVRDGRSRSRGSRVTLPARVQRRGSARAAGATRAGCPRVNTSAARAPTAERRAQRGVARVADRREHGERVGAAGHEDGDERRARPGRPRPRRRCPRPRRRARARRRRRRRARARSSGPGTSGATGPCRPGSRHPRLDRAQAAAGLGRGLAQDRGARVVLAVAGLHRTVLSRSGSRGTAAIELAQRVLALRAQIQPRGLAPKDVRRTASARPTRLGGQRRVAPERARLGERLVRGLRGVASVAGGETSWPSSA